jgi:hypothetical protein
VEREEGQETGNREQGKEGGAVAVVIVAIPIAARRHKSFEQHYPCRTTTDNGFKKADAPPSNIKLCACGTWNERMLIETVNSIIMTLFHGKKISRRADIYIEARLSYLTALINILLVITDGVMSFADFTL